MSATAELLVKICDSDDSRSTTATKHFMALRLPQSYTFSIQVSRDFNVYDDNHIRFFIWIIQKVISVKYNRGHRIKNHAYVQGSKVKLVRTV